MTRWLETDSLSNQDISSALAIGAYTADADRMILVQFFADQVAGNGDYEFYVTLRVNGAGSSYRLIPITTAAAASGLTAIGGQSGMIAVRSGDVVTVYLDGLAGDNSTPDTTVRWFEMAALRPTTADRTLDVSAGGEAGVDWANVGSPTTTVGLSGTTIKTATDVETDTADIQGRIPAALVGGRIDANAGAISNSVITAAKFDGSTAFPLTQADSGATAIARTGADSDTLETLSDQIDGVGAGSGLTAQETRDAMKLAPTAGAPAAGSVDAHLDTLIASTAAIQAVTDLIDTSAVTVTASNNAGLLTVYRGVTFAATVSGLTISASWTKVYLTVKTDLGLADTAATIQVIETNPGAGTDGLLYLNGAAPVNPITYADAALTVTQAAGTVAIALSDNLTAQLARGARLHWDLKQIISSTSSGLLASGTMDIELTPTRTI